MLRERVGQAGERPALLRVVELVAGYSGRRVLDGVSFEVGEGERVALVGPNGAGKTTLFKCIAGLLRPWSGRVELLADGGPGRPVGGAIAYTPQRESVNWHFPATVFDVVMMGRLPQLGWWRRPRRQDVEAVLAALEEVGMAALRDRPLQELSGGQQQRVFLARALAQRARLVLLDEPFNALEPKAQEAVVRALSRLKAQGTALLISTHDLEFVAESRWFDRVLVLNGRLLAEGPPERVCAGNATGERSLASLMACWADGRASDGSPGRIRSWPWQDSRRPSGG